MKWKWKVCQETVPHVQKWSIKSLSDSLKPVWQKMDVAISSFSTTTFHYLPLLWCKSQTFFLSSSHSFSRPNRNLLDWNGRLIPTAVSIYGPWRTLSLYYTSSCFFKSSQKRVQSTSSKLLKLNHFALKLLNLVTSSRCNICCCDQNCIVLPAIPASGNWIFLFRQFMEPTAKASTTTTQIHHLLQSLPTVSKPNTDFADYVVNLFRDILALSSKRNVTAWNIRLDLEKRRLTSNIRKWFLMAKEQTKNENILLREKSHQNTHL